MEETNTFQEDTTMPEIPSSEERTLALLAHIITIVSFFLGPLIIYLVKKDDSPFVAEHAKESLNFQITMALAYIVAMILIIVLIGLFLLWLIPIFTLIMVIIATIKAAEGKPYRYPVCIRFIK